MQQSAVPSARHRKAGEELTIEIAGMIKYFLKISNEKLQWYQKRQESSSLSEEVNTNVPSVGIWDSISRRAKVIKELQCLS